MSVDNVKQGEKFPEEFTAFIEIPENSPVKYEVDEDSGLMMVDRFMYTALVYPVNYGFIPGTYAEDGDATDVLVLASAPLAPGVLIKVRPVGMLEMEDEEGIDNKVLAVPVAKVDPNYSHVEDMDDVGEATKEKIRHFFEYYKKLEKGKFVKLREFKNKKAAIAEIEKSKK